jgi:rifampicin phosphotransferase
VAGVWVRRLEELGAGDLSSVGGKGANLGELVAAGVPVPPAFCVTTDAYCAFLAASNLGPRLAELLAAVDYDDPAGIEATAARIRTLLVASPIPDDIAAAVEAGYAALEATAGAGVSVSVRSSATAEDLPGASFAGQQDTYLYIAGGPPVLDAMRRCWASLWTARAISYRHTQGFDHLAVHLAVVVQQMFPSAVSGVLFTANPLTANPDECFVNASWGLGEAVVSGRVNPDQLLVRRHDLTIVERQTADKVIMTVPDPSGQGTVEVDVPEGQRLAPALSDDQVKELCELAGRIEEHYGFPQDIEWGWADGRFAILQAREITGADLDLCAGLELWKSPRARAEMYDERWTWSRAYSDEVQTGPSTPSFYSYLQLGMTRLKMSALTMTATTSLLGYTPETFVDFPYFRWYGARAYYNLAFEQERIRRFIPPFARDEAALWPFPAEERDAVREMPFDWDAFLGLLRHLHETNPDISLLGTTRIVYEGLERWTDAEDAFWDDVDLANASVREIFASQVASRTGSRFGENVVLPFTIYLYLLPQALQTVCAAWLDDDGAIYNRLVGGLQTKTGEENIAVWELSRAIKASAHLTDLVLGRTGAEVLVALEHDEAGRDFRQQLDAFLARYGHRGGAERDAYHRRWHHDPALVFDSIRPMLALDDDDSPERHEERQRAQMLATKADSVARLCGVAVDAGEVHELGWLVELHALTGETAADRAELFAWFVEVVQDYFYYRDFERFYNDKTMSRSRRLYEAIANRFLAKGLLVDADDVFFLGRDEMLLADDGELSARDVAIRVRARRRVYAKYAQQEPPKYLRGWHAFDDDQLDDDGALRGIAASVGQVTGRARVCRHLSEIAKIERGDILVTVATDPGWTTVFSIIGGIVVETGGVVAHAVMISREYGLPCVANLSRACDLIPDGAQITVDGSTGRVWVHDGPAG